MNIYNRLIITVLVLLTPACTTLVNVDYSDDLKSKTLVNFKIQPTPANKTADPRFDNAFMEKRIVVALADNMIAKGFTLNPNQADFIVKYHLAMKQELESNDSGVVFGIGTVRGSGMFGMSFSSRPETSSYDKLVLTVDITENKTNKLLWRGSLARRVYNGSTPETNNKLINELIITILKEFPPK